MAVSFLNSICLVIKTNNRTEKQKTTEKKENQNYLKFEWSIRMQTGFPWYSICLLACLLVCLFSYLFVGMFVRYPFLCVLHERISVRAWEALSICWSVHMSIMLLRKTYFSALFIRGDVFYQINKQRDKSGRIIARLALFFDECQLKPECVISNCILPLSRDFFPKWVELCRVSRHEPPQFGNE